MGFGRVIRSRREQLNLGQSALARRVGATQQTISRWERGDQLPPPRHFLKLSRALEMSPSALLALAGYGDVEPSGMPVEQLQEALPRLDQQTLLTLAIDVLDELRRRGER